MFFKERTVSALLIPDFMFEAFSLVSPEFLKRQRITALLCDIDNTLSPYEDEVPNDAVRRWVSEMQAAGISLALVSNNAKERVEVYNAPLGLVAFADAKKPSRKRYLDAMAAIGVDKADCAVLGDQLLTDAWSAKRLGIPSIIVRPIRDKKTLFFRFKRMLEVPFIKAYQSKQKRSMTHGK